MKRKFEFVDQMSEDFSLGPIEGMKRFCAALETERMSAAEVEAGFLQDSVTSRFQVDVFWTLHLAGLLSFAKYCETTSGKKNISEFLRLTLSERDESSLVACLGSEILSYLITEVPEEGSNILVASMFRTNEAVLSSEWAPEDVLYCEILLRRLQDFDSTPQMPNRFPKTVFYGVVLNKLVALPLDSSNNAVVVAWRTVASLCFEFFAIYLNHHLRDSESILMDYSSARPSCELVFSVFLAEAARSSVFSEVLDIIRGVWAVAVSEQSSHLIGRCLWLLEAIVVVCNSCDKASISEIFLVVDGLLVKACDDQNDSDKAKVLEFTLLAMCEFSSFQSEPFLNLLCRVVRQRREQYKETADIFLGSARARLKQFEALRTGGIENISEPSVAPTTPSVDSASVLRSELDKSVDQLELSGERVASWAATLRRTTYLPGVVSQLCTQHSSSGFLRGLEFLAKRDKKIRSQCIEIVTAMAKQAPPLCSEVDMSKFCGSFSSVLPATLSSQPCEALGALEELFLSGKRSDLYPKSEVSHALQYLARLLEAVEKRLLLTVEAVDLLLSSWSLKCGIIRKGLSREETREFLAGFYFVVQQLLVKCQSVGVDSFVWSWWSLVYRIIESLINCFGCDGLESVIMESITSESLEPHDFLSIGSMLLLLPEKVSWQFAETAVAKINTDKAKDSLSKLQIIVRTALKHSLLRDSDLPRWLRTSSLPMVYLFVWCSHQLNETFATETDDLMLEVLMSALGCSSRVCSTSELAGFLGSRPMSAICNWEKHCGGSIAKEELSFQRVLDYSCRIWRSNALDRNSFEKDRLLPMGLLVSQLTEKLGNILSDSTTLKNQVIADGIAKFSIQRLCFSSEDADKQDTNVTLFFRELYERYFDTGNMQKKAHPSESGGIAKITETYLRMKSCDSSLSAALATLCSPFLCDPKILQSVPSLLYKDYLSSSESVAVSAAAIICSLKREILKCSSKELMVSQQELVASIAQAYRRVSPANTSSFTAEVIRWAILDSIRRLREDSEKTENHGIVLSRAISGDVKIASPSAPGGVLTVTLTVSSVRTLGWAISLLFALSDQINLSEIKLLEIVAGSPINVSGAHLESYGPQSQCSVWLLLMLTGALSAVLVLGTRCSVSVKLKRLLFNWLAMLLNSSSSELLSDLKTLQTTDTIDQTRDLQSNSSASKDSKFAENIRQVLVLKTSTESKISSLIELEVLSQFPSFVATSNWKI